MKKGLILAFLLAALLLPILAFNASPQANESASNISSLLGSVTGTIGRPSDGMLLLVREYKEETAQATAVLNQIIAASTKK
jgi:hypothetical protein